MSPFYKTNQTLKEYRRYRRVGRNLNQKIIEAYLNETTLEKATTMLKLGQKRLVVVDSEDDFSVLMDFSLFEIRQSDGKNSVEHYAEEKGGTNAIERDLLTAMVKAQTGLFKVGQVLRDRRQIMLENLIDPETPITLTDINFSQTLISGLVIFFRPICTTKFTMTSGVAFAFPAGLEQELTTRWRRLDSRGDAQRFAWFFRKSKQSGIETIYV
jgi:hypothetical protein